MAPQDDRFRLLPGMALAALVTGAAYLLALVVGRFGLGPPALAVLLGFLVGNLWQMDVRIRPGVVFVGRRGLTLAVVLLGLAVQLSDLTGVGSVLLGVAVGVVVAAILLALLASRLFGVPGPLAALVGVGTGICGVAAIAAARPAVGARDEDLAYAVASVTFLGSLGLLVYPLVQLAWHPLGPEAYGILSGATLHSVPQAVGAAFAGGGDPAGELATVTKLSRVALLGPVVLALALGFRNGEAKRGALRVPVEVWGFLTFFVLGSILPVPDALRAAVAWVDHVLLVAALAALGLTTRFVDLRRAGAAPFALAVVVWLVVLGGVAVGLRAAI